MAHRRLLDMRRNNPDGAELGSNLSQRRNTRTVDSIVIAYEDAHGVIGARGTPVVIE